MTRRREAPPSARQVGPKYQTIIVGSMAAILLIAFIFQTLSTIETTAPTFDEVAHLPAGYAQLLTGTPTLNIEHPPLAKLIAAAALWPDGGGVSDLPPNWASLDEWSFGQAFLFAPGRNPTALMARARRGPILLGLLLCVACFVWSLRLYGPAGGLFTLALCVFCPTLLAHTRLVTTDVPVAAFGVLAASLTWALMSRATIARCVGIGLAIGAALACKFSGVLFLPALACAVIYIWWRRRSDPEHFPMSASRTAFLTLLVAGVAAAVVVVSYGWPVSLNAYVDGVAQVGANQKAGFQSYLFGEYRAGGFPLYFPIAFLIKTSPAVLIALVLFAALPLLRRVKIAGTVRANGVDARLFLWVPVIVYAGFIMLTAPDLGIRYWIPVYPFLFVALGLLGASLWSSTAGKAILVALLSVHLYAARQAWPDPISYFNGLFGCSGSAAIKCLNDSNLDWGQDLGRVATEVNRLRRPDDEVALLYFGTAYPGAYLQNWRPMRVDEILHPQHGIYAVSLHELEWGMAHVGRPNGMDWFEKFHPAAIVGNTYFIYDFRDPK